jgi:hypothetical protein
MQIAILSGIYSDNSPDFRTSYPRNLIPIPKDQGISQGYLRPAYGIVEFGVGTGIDRGAINWNGVYYRVMGTKLLSIDSSGVYTIIGDVGGTGSVTFDYSFDRLAIVSSGSLYYWTGTVFEVVTDPDLGVCKDVVWVDGYFMSTDGVNLIVTELNDPMSINPLKYGSSEADPDPINGLLKVRNEVYAMNRYTIEVFDNVGGVNFPFARVSGAQIQKGVIGTRSACVIADMIAFMGSARNETPSIYLGANASAVRIATDEIDQILLDYTETQLSDVVLEVVTNKGNQYLLVHLPDQTLAYDHNTSQLSGQKIWFTLTTSIVGKGQYRAKNIIWCYDRWLCGDPTSTSHGYFDDNISSHYGNINGWDFGTSIIYNEGRGAIFHELELVSLTGRVALGKDPTIYTQYSTDGLVWSNERFVNVGKQGDRNKRIVWFSQGMMQQLRMQRFRGTSDAHISIARLEARLEPLSV